MTTRARRRADVDRAAAQPGRRRAAARAAAARPATGLRRVLDLRLRRRDPGRAGRRARLRRACSPCEGPQWYHVVHGRPLRQQPAPVERRTVLLHHGHPSVGQVLHGRLARPTRDDLGHRRDRVPRLDRRPRSPATSIQSNFDSQWITTQAKDGLNSVGVGAWFNVLDYGQMLLFHVILLPLVLGVLVVWHVLLVRRRGVVPPFATDDRRRRRPQRPREPSTAAHREVTSMNLPSRTGAGSSSTPGRGAGRYRRYDIVKEFVVALVVMALLTVGLAIVFGSPDRKRDHAVGLGDARRPPTSSPPPSPNSTAPAAPRPTARRTPTTRPPGRSSARCRCNAGAASANRSTPRPTSCSARWRPAPTRRHRGAGHLPRRLSRPADRRGPPRTATRSASAPDGDPAKVAAGDYGPVPALAAGLLAMAQRGALDGLLQEQGGFYQTNYSRSLLFLADGTYLEDQARARAPRRRPVGHDERDRHATRARHGCGCTRSGTRSRRSPPPTTPTPWSGA